MFATKNVFMENTAVNAVTIETTVYAPIEKIWEYFTEPQHIMQWYHASDDWHAPAAENDLQPGGKFSTTMAARDGSFSFDFWGIYDNITPLKSLQFTLGDGRKVAVNFMTEGDHTTITESFETESTNTIELQRNGWQAILNNFKAYTESR